MPAHEEIRLSGGHVTDTVVRVGDTVRKPAGPWTPSVHALLVHLDSVGFAHAPRSLGVDDQGRHVLEYVDGQLQMPYGPSRPNADLTTIGKLIRGYHDAAEGFVSPKDAVWNVAIVPDAEDLVIHHDLAPWNLLRTPERFVLIDWDGAGPGSPLWDLAYACLGFVPLAPGVDVAIAARRLARLARGYGLDQRGRGALAALLDRRALSMYSLLEQGGARGRQPWSRLWAEGHGATWLAIARYAQQHRDVFAAALVDAT